MNHSLRTSLPFFVLALAAPVAVTQACWPVAPPGGQLLDSGEEPDAYLEGGATQDGPIGTNDGTTQGNGSSGDGGTGDAAEASAPPPFPSPTLAAGLGFGCHIDTKGAVWCWGDNTFGQIGLPAPSKGDGGPQQVPLGTGDAGLTATALALGDDYACAVTSQKTVYCWGHNDQGQLDHDAATWDSNCLLHGLNTPCTWTPTPTSTTTLATSIAAAGVRTCALGTDGSVQCWGQPEDAGIALSSVGVLGAAQLAVGTEHACALIPAPSSVDAGDAGLEIECWGANDERQVHPLKFCPPSGCAPIVSPNVSQPEAVTAGSAFTCGISGTGGVICFGDNSAGELGHAPGTNGDTDGAVPFNGAASAVPGVSSVTALVASGNAHVACALQNGGSVACWGDVGGNTSGTPITITGLPAMGALGSADGKDICGAATDGGIWCWSLDAGASPPTQVQ